jgi:hypothetical protein
LIFPASHADIKTKAGQEELLRMHPLPGRGQAGLRIKQPSGKAAPKRDC